MELSKLKKFIEFMNEHELCELEVEEKDSRIKLKKNIGNIQPVVTAAVPIPPAAADSQGSEIQAKGNEIEIKSPMVGTFYRAPSPGAKPYSEIGNIIQPGDVVCIIEAMKLMNEIKSETSGKIVRIAVENGEPIEFGQTLFIIEPV